MRLEGQVSAWPGLEDGGPVGGGIRYLLTACKLAHSLDARFLHEDVQHSVPKPRLVPEKHGLLGDAVA